MTLAKMTIEHTPRKKRGMTQEVKTSRFSSTLLGFLAGDGLWDAGESGKRHRPILIAYFGTDQELLPFTANFRMGRKAETTNEVFEMMKTAPYRWTTQKVPGGGVTVAYLPELFHLDALPEAQVVRFVFAPPRWWVREQAAILEPDFGDDAEDAARAALFAAYVDRRSPMPVLDDLRFQLRLYRAAQEAVFHDCERNRHRSVLYGTCHPRWGFEDPVAVRLHRQDLTEFLIAQTHLYYQEEARHGQNRIPANRRLLQNPSGSPVQLRLDFDLAA